MRAVGKDLTIAAFFFQSDDDETPAADTPQLLANRGPPPKRVIELDNRHRFADPEPLVAMSEARERLARIHSILQNPEIELGEDQRIPEVIGEMLFKGIHPYRSSTIRTGRFLSHSHQRRTLPNHDSLTRRLLLVLVVTCGILGLLATPSIQHLFRWREHNRLASQVQENITSMQQRRPTGVSERQWNLAVDWTANLIAQVYFAPVERDPDSLRALRDALDERLTGNVNFDTLRWIWDECERAPRPGAKYAIQFRDVRLLTPEPITDEDLPGLWSLDRCLYLDLDDTEVTDRGLEHLRPYSNLKYLTLRGTHVTEQGLAHLQEALPECEISHATSNAESDE